MKSTLALTLALLTSAAAFAGEPAKETLPPPPEPDRWKFALSAPGWFTGISGDVGLDESSRLSM